MNFQPPPPPPKPRTIRNDKPGKQVVIAWASGEQDTISWERLRWACPCALCHGEAGIPGRLASVTELTDDEMTLESLAAVGNYAITALWKNGHDTGIYPYPMLKALCEAEAEARPSR